MIYIQHRVNDNAALASLGPNYGAEIDLRSQLDGSLYLHHDPFRAGASFELWLQTYAVTKRAAPLILNTKEDGLESAVKQMCEKYGVENYFFLDTAFPTLVKWSLRGNDDRFAVRISVYETAAAALPFQKYASWAWVDCFDGNPLPLKAIEPLLENFKICLVSPELHGQPVERISEFELLYAHASAICTKRPDVWIRTFEQKLGLGVPGWKGNAAT